MTTSHTCSSSCFFVKSCEIYRLAPVRALAQAVARFFGLGHGVAATGPFLELGPSRRRPHFTKAVFSEQQSDESAGRARLGKTKRSFENPFSASFTRGTWFPRELCGERALSLRYDDFGSDRVVVFPLMFVLKKTVFAESEDRDLLPLGSFSQATTSFASSFGPQEDSRRRRCRDGEEQRRLRGHPRMAPDTRHPLPHWELARLTHSRPSSSCSTTIQVLVEAADVGVTSV